MDRPDEPEKAVEKGVSGKKLAPSEEDFKLYTEASQDKAAGAKTMDKYDAGNGLEIVGKAGGGKIEETKGDAELRTYDELSRTKEDRTVAEDAAGRIISQLEQGKGRPNSVGDMVQKDVKKELGMMTEKNALRHFTGDEEVGIIEARVNEEILKHDKANHGVIAAGLYLLMRKE
jgi:hypothetical protein